MIRIKSLVLFLLICFCQQNLLAQNQKWIVDSLLIILKTRKEDTSKVNILNDVSNKMMAVGYSDYKGAREYADSALQLAIKLNFKRGEAAAYGNIGHSFHSQSNFPEASKYILEFLRISEEISDKRGMATAYFYLGRNLRQQGNIPEAIKNLNASLKLWEEVGDKSEIALRYEGIGFAYGNFLRNYPEALKNYSLALKIKEEMRDRPGMANTFINMANVYARQLNNTEAMRNYKDAINIFEATGNKPGLGRAYHNIAFMYYNQDNYAEALKYGFNCLKLQEEIGDRSGTIQLYDLIVSVYFRQGNYTDALKYSFTGLKIMEELGDKKYTANAYTNIGAIYSSQGNETEALKYYLTSLKLWEEIGGKEIISNTYTNIGLIYSRQGNYTEALKNYSTALKFAEELNNAQLMANASTSIGLVYNKQRKYSEALRKYYEALKLYENGGDKQGIANVYIEIGHVVSEQAESEKGETTELKFAQALQSLNKGLSLAKEIEAKPVIRSAYEELAKTYKRMNDYKMALEYHNLYVALKDSLMNNETTRKLEQQRTQYEVEKAVAEEKAQQEKVLAAQKFKSEKELADKNAKHELELAEEQLKKEKAIEIEKLKYEFALAEEQADQDKIFATQQIENDKKMADENAKHQQAIANEKSKQQIKDVEAKTLLENEKAAKKRRTEAFGAGLVGLALISFFTIVIIRQRNQKRRAVEKAETGHKMAELELQSLRAQLNPHFMFNSLNAIQDLIVNENSEKSHLYLSRFSKLLRILLDNANQPFVTIKQELELLELYLSLENLRIPNLQYSIEKDPKLKADERMIPNMMLQPYIENAIWHGLSNKKGERKLQVRIHENGTATEFEVEDNGIGRKRSAELKRQFRHGHHSKGMQLLSKRFELLSKEYGTSIQTQITDLENNGDATGTLVKIEVPFTISEQAKELVHDTDHHN